MHFLRPNFKCVFVKIDINFYFYYFCLLSYQQRFSGSTFDPLWMCSSLDASEDLALPPRELYLRACRLTGASPVSCFLHHSGKGPLALNHRGLGPQGAKALAIALVVIGLSFFSFFF